eukprot:9748030-Ditylum_brightwellii.AAC.1
MKGLDSSQGTELQVVAQHGYRAIREAWKNHDECLSVQYKIVAGSRGARLQCVLLEMKKLGKNPSMQRP